MPKNEIMKEERKKREECDIPSINEFIKCQKYQIQIIQ
jgi:hypothetical protein